MRKLAIRMRQGTQFVRKTYAAIRHIILWFVTRPPVIILLLIAGVYMFFAFGLDDWDAKNVEHIRNWALIFGGIFAIIFATWRSMVAQKQVDLAAQSHAIDRMNNAVAMLSSKKLYERIGAIHSLQQIMRLSAKSIKTALGDKQQALNDWDIANKILREFIRNAAQEIAIYREQKQKIDNWLTAEEEQRGEKPNLIPCPDIRNALTTLQNETQFHVGKGGQGDRSYYDLSGALLMGLELHGLTLTHFNFSAANFSLSNFVQTKFHEANCFKAEFHKADCQEAQFHGANCLGAKFHKAECQWAEFHGAECLVVEFISCDVSGANFSDAKNLNNNKWDDSYYREMFPPEGLPDDILQTLKPIEPA